MCGVERGEAKGREAASLAGYFVIAGCVMQFCWSCEGVDAVGGVACRGLRC